ncbi:CBF-domain-containing protein [Xylariaceae sp. FL0016]|nr:CBF-domain-containing protein [Xylariaceae sp. FL0016]
MATTFDAAALSKLTAKIDSKLSQSKNPKNKRKLDQTADVPQPPPKKRVHDGKQAVKADRKVKARLIAKPGAKSNGKRNEDRPRHNQKKDHSAPEANDSDILLQEIKALGGDENDYKLIEGVDSDDEMINDQESKKSTDKALRAELAQFAAGLGFDKVAPETADEDEDAEPNDSAPDENESSDGSDDETAEKTPQDSKRKTIFEPRPDWYSVDLRSLPSPASDDIAPYTPAISALKNYAKTILDEDTAAYSKTFSASSSRKFMSTIMTSGTMSDKVSALTLAIQESPVHNIKALENLMSLGAKRSRGQALAALAALVDLLGPGMILPSERRLRTFESQLGLIGTLQKITMASWSPAQALPGKITKGHLISWIFEDWLKDSYFKMIQSLEVWCDDEVEYSRIKGVDMVFALLRDKPEQESNLLRLLVNKLGDRERKIASRAQYLLLQLLNTHPAMKQIVVKAVEQDVIFRPGQNIRAKYYAINTLNQTILSTKEPELADSLLRIYFGMFVSLLKSGELSELDVAPEAVKPNKRKQNRGRAGPVKAADEKPASSEKEAAEKLVSAILTGVNRAVPFSQADSSTLESHLDTLFRITHSSNFNTSIQALLLIQQLSTNRHLATERFYRTLYESLLDPRLVTSSKQALYLNLLFRSLKNDVDVRRVKAFVKRMLQVLNLHQPSFVCGILYLVIELSNTFPDLRTLINDPEDNDTEEATGLVASDAPADGTLNPGQDTTRAGAYDGRKRDPEYSNAHRSCLWELVPFLKHFHPSVDVFASGLLNGKTAIKKPELANHTLIAFLDKFVYKNAKAGDQAKGVSIMQPVAASGQGSILLSTKPSTKEAGSSLNSASFWNKKSEDVAVDDVFFHEYFTQIGKPGQTEREKQKAVERDSAEAEDGEEVDEDEIWDALVKSNPEIDGDSDDDAGFDDLMSLDDSEDDGLDKDAGGDENEEDSEDIELEFLGESDLDSQDDNDEDDTEAPGVTEAKEKQPQSERAKRKKALKNLPLFASADDYAEMLGQDEDTF